jgi:ATP-dependent RNA helicase DHX37/DHR1
LYKFFYLTIDFAFLFSESESSSSDNEEDDETINDEEIRKALQPSQPTPVVLPPVIKRRQRESSTSSTEETKVDVPARPHANVQVERSEEIQAVRSQLPIITEEQAIMEAIHDNLVVLICGETGKKIEKIIFQLLFYIGSGKTTQLPQFLYEAGYTLDGKMIGITEPRRVAAISMASRVAHELNLTNEFVHLFFSIFK